MLTLRLPRLSLAGRAVLRTHLRLRAQNRRPGRQNRREKPIYVMLDGDVAHTLGAILREDCKLMSEILCIDGVMLMDFDYIDLGRVRVPSYTVPGPSNRWSSAMIPAPTNASIIRSRPRSRPRS
jgi:hypothetical protein